MQKHPLIVWCHLSLWNRNTVKECGLRWCSTYCQRLMLNGWRWSRDTQSYSPWPIQYEALWFNTKRMSHEPLAPWRWASKLREEKWKQAWELCESCFQICTYSQLYGQRSACYTNGLPILMRGSAVNKYRYEWIMLCPPFRTSVHEQRCTLLFSFQSWFIFQKQKY